MDDVLKDEQEQRIAEVRKDFWVGYTAAKSILADLDDLVNYPRKIRMPNIAIIGDTNNGKSFILDRFVKKHSRPFDPNEENTTLPIVHIRLRAKADEARFYNAILSSLFASGPDRESADSKLDRIHRLLFQLDSQILVVDEFQHSTCGTKSKTKELLNAVKNVGSDRKMSIVIGGTPEVLNALSSDTQIENRFVPRQLMRWKLDDEFLSLLATIQIKLKLREKYDLTDDSIARLLLLLSGGIIGDLVDLLVYLAVHAIRTKTEAITKEMLDIQYLKKIGWTTPSQRTKYDR